MINFTFDSMAIGINAYKTCTTEGNSEMKSRSEAVVSDDNAHERMNRSNEQDVTSIKKRRKKKW